MSMETDQPAKPAGRVVTAETLSVAPGVLGQLLAEPWRRLVAMALDISVVGLLSLLSTPFLGLAIGVLLIVLLGNRREAPLLMKALRWLLRGVGVAVFALSLLALGHVSKVQSRGLNLEALTNRAESAALKETVFVPTNPSMSDLRVTNAQLQEQVETLKREYREQQVTGSSWLYQARAFTGALGVTFGWSGIYFTLIAGFLRGKTLGKFLLRIRAVKLNGKPLTFFDAFLRHGGYMAGLAMGLLGFLKLLWEPNRQAVEDRIVGTVVIKG